MAEEKKDKKIKTEAEKKKMQKNMIVLFAIAVLIGAGAYYFINQKNINTSNPSDINAEISKASEKANTGTTLAGKKWTWINTTMSDGAKTSPSEAGAFTLTFQPDMTVIATTDCNNGNGSYELGPDNALTFGPMATSMMFCEGSSETDFYQSINNVGSYKIDNGQLWLMIKFDSGTMVFE